MPKDGVSRLENLNSQPHTKHRAFNNSDTLTCGWYPVCPSKELKREKARSFKIFKQRIVVYRTKEGKCFALDSFCPHLGADLGNAHVVGENIKCYFHQWELSSKGCLVKVACMSKLDKSVRHVKNRSYPIREEYGHIWVFSKENASHELIKPWGLESEQSVAFYLKEVTLFAHHHIMMANGVDLQHFSTVHGLDIDFKYDVDEKEDGTFHWRLKGDIASHNLKTKLARLLLGETFEYCIKFAGGSLVSISYGVNGKIFGMKFPPLNVLWGCLPMENGISKVRIFFVAKKRKGLLGKLKNTFLYFLTFLLLAMLRDEDIEAFPYMRFNTHNLIGADKSLGRFIQLINQSELSDWGKI